MKEKNFMWILTIRILLIILIKADNESDTKEDILYKSEKQGFNISNPNDNFYNDICQYYSIGYLYIHPKEYLLLCFFLVQIFQCNIYLN